MRTVYVGYEEAQRLIPYFTYAKKEAPFKEVRESAIRLFEELHLVRPIQYDLGGKQVVLSEKDYDYFVDAQNAMHGHDVHENLETSRHIDTSKYPLEASKYPLDLTEVEERMRRKYPKDYED
jgi:hypothetical protein